MKNTSQLLKGLRKLGFRLVDGNGGSTIKIYPPNPAMPFYSCHIGERMIHPLKRFARTNWGINLEEL